MKQIKPVLLIISLLIIVSFLVPTLLVLPFSSEKVSGKLDEQIQKPKTKEPTVEVAVYRTKTKQIEKPDLENYVVGVVASEMPASFEKEALKAQALTARTYIVKQLMYGGNSSVPKGAVVEDTQNFQVYQNMDELKKEWGNKYNRNIKKIRKAVEETAGQILTYNGSPITAAFFSTSNGFTENSEDYWGNPVPYLKSVKSPWDKTSPKFSYKEAIPVSVFENKLNVQLSNTGSIGTVTSRTHGNRVGTITIDGKKFTGRDIRDRLGLRSSDFDWVRKGDNIIITTKGYGHGIGMSQYGANGMAKEGKNYQDIVKYYYKGIKITSTNQFLNKVTARK
ncbi:stage II sporulation protein D [Bacillus sp. FJAT-49736]|uniref:stage II sporulation protein D n=1 Tax=Bacillus sp. FJAT-49736 TaxID=2833582 RepID=UPI001BC8D77A|nr:stage II sporulation protein D [Bacillus sp. FJAT-49736]MBS4175435.1 stage II sporulation protein D [Bacillus sp. FJAT-49736]